MRWRRFDAEVQMSRRVLVARGVAVGIGVGSLAMPLSGQTLAPSGGALAKAADPKTWTAPRTPWGDPDLQGNFTNKYEQGTPFERPDEFAGRKIEDVKKDELADILQERQDRALLSITLAGGDPAGNLGGPLWWQDQFEVGKG